MKKCLITGSLGLVGSEAVDFFKDKGWKVVGIDNNQRSKLFGVEESKLDHSVDIRDEKAIDALFSLHKFDAIIHTAAQPSHDWAKKEPLTDFDINARGTLILLEATRKYSPKATFVHCSTDKVYGENMMRAVTEKPTRYDAWYPFDEYTELDQAMRSLFGCSKLASDIYVQEYGYYFDMKTVCFRPGCITGKRHKGAEEHGFLAYLAKCIKEGKNYNIFGYKGKQVRDLIHSYDLVNAFWHFIKDPKEGEVYNIGGGEERSVSILEAIQMIEKETGKKAVTTYIDEERKGDRIWDIHDVTKFQEDYPKWKYKYSLDDIIKEICL